jgi:hypothetical protein
MVPDGDDVDRPLPLDLDGEFSQQRVLADQVSTDSDQIKLSTDEHPRRRYSTKQCRRYYLHKLID